MTRRISFLTLLMVVLVLLPVAAHADFLYEYQDLTHSFSLSFVQPTLESSGTVTSFLTASDVHGFPLVAFAWNSAALGTCLNFLVDGTGCTLWVSEGETGPQTGLSSYADGSFLSPGTYTSDPSRALALLPVAPGFRSLLREQHWSWRCHPGWHCSANPSSSVVSGHCYESDTFKCLFVAICGLRKRCQVFARMLRSY